MTRITIVVAAALALAATLLAAPAQATGAARTFVSAAGSDGNNCTNVASPCRHLAAAYAATAPSGEIFVLDPANYGSLTITGPVSIEGHGWASIAPVTNSAAITINAAPNDKINIIGVVLDGTAITNSNGIVFNTGGSLTIRDSVIRNFTGAGIQLGPNSLTLTQLYVTNTIVSDNDEGILISELLSGTTNCVLDQVHMENNSRNGLDVETPFQTIVVTVTDSVSANNGNDGIFTVSNGTPVAIMVRNSTIASNGTGLDAEGAGATIRVTRSTITGNTVGWVNGSSGEVSSYGDNTIAANTSGNNAPSSAGPLE